MKYRTFSLSNDIYKSSDIDTLLEMLETDFVKTNKKVEYLNIPISFDIETSSFYKGDEKVSIMYVWMVNINGINIVGRKWSEFEILCSKISEYFLLSTDRRAIIYVHNLAYEFQFICKRFHWLKVFAIDVRKPVYALTDLGIEFRCSYLLSGYSLERLGDNLLKYKVTKLVGNLDYSKIRHSETILTDSELLYCINDVKVVSAYIQERIEHDGDITKLPLTKTGYVRQHCKYSCFGRGKRQNRLYKKMIQSMTLGCKEYEQLKRAFQGGFTHANPFYSGKVIENVSSFDFTSSYPTVMISEKFPMMKGERVNITSTSQFDTYLKLYCCLFDVIIEGLESRYYFDSYISLSRTWDTVRPIINNGRIVSADRVCMTITEQDYMIINAMYTWDNMKVGNFIIYRKSYLPTQFVTTLLDMYKDKTMLKGIQGKDYEYARSKEMLNSAYGMIVTDICRDDISFANDEWECITPSLEKMINKYNTSKSRFLFYPWGVWVTAYARRNLFTGILECKEDYVYSDTDSIKIINADSHMGYIDKYNNIITQKLLAAMNFHGLDDDSIFPLTMKGDIKPLGIWDYEGTYDRFKTLGAKRYLVESNGEYHLTVSGLRKQIAIEYMKQQSNDIFEFFNDEMYIPKGHTGKMIHTYIDDLREGKIEDYNGIVSDYSEKSSVHLEPCDYSLKISHVYADYLMGLETRYL